MKPEYIMIHHSAVSHEKNSDQFIANNNYHKAQWGFKSSMGFFLGYNYEIAASGKVSQARADGEPTAACYQKSMNDGRCIHICLDGNFDTEKPKPGQIFALRDLIKKVASGHRIKRENIVFHSEYANKSCPGENMDLNFVRSLVPEIKREENTVKENIAETIEKLIDLIDKL